MKELQEILARIEQLEPGEQAVLATVVDVRGSSYRLPGARMLIAQSGQTFGTVSGGCLEADVLERAKKVVQTGKPSVFTYDTTDIEDSIFNLNMGCRGIIRILLEPLEAENSYFRFLKQCLEKRTRGVVATVINASANFALPTGAHFVFEATAILPRGLDRNLQELVARDVQTVLANGVSQLKVYDSTEIFIELIRPPISLVVFGAGADAVPLINLAKNLGWHTTVVDHRVAVATKERFPSADEIVISRPENLNENLFSHEQTVAVVMSHNYERDREILRRVLKSPLLYVGALGPKRRAESLLAELRDEGEIFSEEQLDKLFAPVGLDIGAATPEAIALSIAAEIQTVLNQRAGGFLRNRQGSIYGRSALPQ